MLKLILIKVMVFIKKNFIFILNKINNIFVDNSCKKNILEIIYNYYLNIIFYQLLIIYIITNFFNILIFKTCLKIFYKPINLIY